MDRASIIAIEEVCKRCPLYTKHCGMLEYPSQCVKSGHFIDGYRKAEKELALTTDDIKKLVDIYDECLSLTFEKGKPAYESGDFYEEVLRRFREMKDK